MSADEEVEAAWLAWHAMSIGLLHELEGRERDETIWRSAWAAARAGANE